MTFIRSGSRVLLVSSCVTFLPAAARAAERELVVADTDIDQVVVSASRSIDAPTAALLGASFTIIDGDDLRARQVRSMADVLRDVPGVSVSRSGPIGAVTQVRLRGSEANHTLVLVDGMEVTDPFAGEFDFSLLQVDEHARIEVLRGPQSALWGSDAIGGVIQYFTQSGREAPGVSVRAEGGSFATREVAVRWAGVASDVDYAVSLGSQDSDGTPTARNGVRDIGSSSLFFSSRVAWQPLDVLRLRAVLRASRSRAGFNGQDFDFTSPTYGFVIDTDDRSETRSVGGLVAADWDTFHRSLQSGAELRLTQTLTVQDVESGRGAFNGFGRQTGDDGSRFKASYVATLTRAATWNQHLVFAADQERERYRDTSTFATPAQAATHQQDNTGFVLQYDADLERRAAFGLAVRHDRNQRFDDATTLRAQASFRPVDATKLHVAVGSGIKNPTPIELFGYDPESFIGNPALKPEKSKGWEAGVERDLLDGEAQVGMVFARTRLEDEIFTRYSATFVSTPDNRASFSHQRSLELFARARLGESWRIDAAYTRLHADEDGEEEVRRPARTGSLNLTWMPVDALDVTLTARFNGATEDFNFTNFGPPRVTLGAYTLMQLGARYRVDEGFEVFGRIENLLGERYEDVYTYRMPGRAAYAGIRVQL